MSEPTMAVETLEVLRIAVYSVAEPNYPDLEKRLEKINRRAKRIGMPPIEFEIVGSEKKTVKINGGGKEREVTFLTVALNGAKPELLGWDFVASITHHSEEGNVLRYVPGYSDTNVDIKYRTASPACDHCKLNRRRNDTYVVRFRESGEEKQVGRNCLADFFNGIKNPHQIAEYAELLSNSGVLLDEASKKPVEVGSHSSYTPSYYGLQEILALAAAVIRENGGRFVSRKTAKEYDKVATVSWVYDILQQKINSDSYAVGPAELALADAAIEWAANIDTTGDDYRWNIHVLASSGICTWNQFGLAVSIVGVYLRTVNPPKPITPRPVGVHVGTVGVRALFMVTVNNTIEVESQFGYSTLFIGSDPDGNTIKWFSSKTDVEKDHRYVVKGTVKAHDDWKGIPQTTLTRVTVVKEVGVDPEPEPETELGL